VQTKPTSDYVGLPHPNLQQKYTVCTENDSDESSDSGVEINSTFNMFRDIRVEVNSLKIFKLSNSPSSSSPPSLVIPTSFCS
jgi:hypothetical protein